MVRGAVGRTDRTQLKTLELVTDAARKMPAAEALFIRVSLPILLLRAIKYSNLGRLFLHKVGLTRTRTLSPRTR